MNRKNGLDRQNIRRKFMALAVVIAILSAGMFPATVSAYTPDDPVVQGMVDRALNFMESKKSGTYGEIVLCAYAHFKVQHDESNELVQLGIEEALKIIDTMNESGSTKVTYGVAVAVFLLAEVDPRKYRQQLVAAQQWFENWQMPEGGFTYKGEKRGDVSQTQYCILALWTLERNGIPISYERMDLAMRYLLAVQHPSGGWPYMPVSPTTGRAQQGEPLISMGLAAASTLLIGGDALGLWGQESRAAATELVGLPKAVKKYIEDENADRRNRKAKVSTDRIFGSIRAMENWRARTPEKKQQIEHYYFYTVYTIERFESFMEIARGGPKDPSPAWYNKIVDELRGMQTEEGGFRSAAYISPQANTAFAVLFLIRSTKKSLGAGASGTTRGGYGFGDNVGNAKLVDGVAVTPSPAQTVTKMLDLLDEDGADQLDGKALARSATLATDPTERSAQLDRLERLVRGSQSYQARRVAAQLLAKSDDFRVVPSLIFALTDPDVPTRNYARDGLRFLSRNFEGFGMPDDPTDTEIRQAQRKWREWYKRLRPNYVFLEE